MGFKSDFLRIAEERGFINDQTDAAALDALAARERITAYIGFDCTAPSLHVGSLVSIMLLRWLQKTGHRPIALMGGGTTKVGDPSFRDESRPLLDEAGIERNKESIQSVFRKFIAFGDGPTDAVLVDNDEWLSQLSYIPFLRDVGRHFSVNRMLTFESVKQRLDREQSLSFLEFNYMILQAYDFVELYRRLGCRLQMGGSDQWGNIVNGTDLGRRMEDVELYGLTTPLITTASGTKMGKTAAGAVWLNPDMLSAYDYWQFWRNTEDADVGRFLKLFTELPLDEVARLEGLAGAEINEAKKVLATEATALLHGRGEAEKAAEAARQTFEAGQTSADLPTVDLPEGDLAEEPAVFALLTRAGLTKSNGEARRLIKGGGVRLNDRPVTDESATASPADLTAEGHLKLSVGKKKHVLLRPV